MSRIRVRQVEDVEWVRIGDMASPDGLDGLTEGERNSDIAFHERGTDTAPQLMEVKYVPDAVVDPHSHDADEIVYVVEGELHLGERVLHPGASMFVAAGAVYSYRAGPAGLRIVNFRPRGDFSFHPRTSG